VGNSIGFYVGIYFILLNQLIRPKKKKWKKIGIFCPVKILRFILHPHVFRESHIRIDIFQSCLMASFHVCQLGKEELGFGVR